MSTTIDREKIKSLVTKYEQFCKSGNELLETATKIRELYDLDYAKLNKFLEKYLPFGIKFLSMSPSASREKGIKEFCTIVDTVYADVQESIKEYTELQIETMTTLAMHDGIIGDNLSDFNVRG